MAPVVNLRSRERNINTGGELYFNQQTGRVSVPTGASRFDTTTAMSGKIRAKNHSKISSFEPEMFWRVVKKGARGFVFVAM